MRIKEAQERVADIKARGNALWEKAETETARMSAEAKAEHMKAVHEQDTAIRAELKNAEAALRAAQDYQQEEKREIVREHKNSASEKDPMEFSGFGQMLQAIAARSSDVVAGVFDSSYRAELDAKLRSYQAAASGMSSGVASDGGYLVRKEWTTEFMDRARRNSMLLPLCTSVPIGPNADGLEYPYIDETSMVNGSRWGGVQVFWKAEAATVTAKQPKIGKADLRLEEIMGLAYVTERLMRDASALEAILTNGFESEFGHKIDDSILRGNGAGQMLGILNSPALISVTRDGDDLVTVTNMLARMGADSKMNAVWLHHQDWLPKLVRLKLGDTPVFIPPGGVPNAPGGRLLGKPLIEMMHCSAVASAGDLIFANFGEYVVIEKANEGVRFDQSMHVRFIYDEMAFRWVKRINGQPIARTAITPPQGSNTLSPFVTVAA